MFSGYFASHYGCQRLFAAISSFIYVVKLELPKALMTVDLFNSSFNAN